MNLDWTYPDKASYSGPQDPHLRSDFASPTAILGQFNTQFAGNPYADQVSLFNVWWVPNKSFTVIYKFVRLDGETEYQTIHFYAPGQAAAQSAALNSKAHDRSTVRLFPSWEAVAVCFPEDPALPNLRRLVAPETIDVLTAADAATSWSLLSYLPGDRAAIRISRSETAGDIAVKMHSGAQATHQAMTKLWAAPNRDFHMAKPLTVIPHENIRCESFLPGIRFSLSSADPDSDSKIVRLMAALVQLHSCDLSNLPTNGCEAIFKRISTKVSKRIQAAQPDLAPAADDLIHKLGVALSRQSEEFTSTIHGDFHTANVIFDGLEPGFIDLDNLAMGSPAYDLALFGTRLLLSGVYDRQIRASAAKLVARLPDIYQAAGGRPIPSEQFAWYVAALLIGRQIKTCIRHAAPQLDAATATLLLWSNNTLRQGRFTPDICAEEPDSVSFN